MMLWRRIILSALLWVATSVMAEEQLWALLAAQEAASGRFLQELYDEQGDLLERSSGRYAVLRPGYFRWQIDYPDKQLLLVSGEVLWHYDIDLATATQRSIGGDANFAPLELLGGDIETVRERFSVETLDASVYRLQPIYPGASFSAVQMNWQDGTLQAMEIIDRSGQRLQLALTPDDDAPSMTPEDFKFSAPEGVELFYDNGS